MLVENSWLNTNIGDRKIDPNVDFSITMTPYNFSSTDFLSASQVAAQKIADLGSKLYLSYSGGIDSEYVFMLLTAMKIPFETIIVITPANKLESDRALAVCAAANVTPIILSVSEKDFLECYLNDVHTKLNGVGYKSPGKILTAYYAEEHNGKLIIGEHIIGRNIQYGLLPEINEWDFYTDAIVKNDTTIPFFLYDLAVVYETTKAMIDNEFSIPTDATFKSTLYNLPVRGKIDWKFSSNFEKVISLTRKIKKNIHKPNTTFSCKKEDLLALLTPYKQ